MSPPTAICQLPQSLVTTPLCHSATATSANSDASLEQVTYDVIGNIKYHNNCTHKNVLRSTSTMSTLPTFLRIEVINEDEVEGYVDEDRFDFNNIFSSEHTRNGQLIITKRIIYRDFVGVVEPVIDDCLNTLDERDISNWKIYFYRIYKDGSNYLIKYKGELLHVDDITPYQLTIMDDGYFSDYRLVPPNEPCNGELFVSLYD